MDGVNWQTKSGRYAGPQTEPAEPTASEYAANAERVQVVIDCLNEAIQAGIEADQDQGAEMKKELEAWKFGWAAWLDAQR